MSFYLTGFTNPSTTSPSSPIVVSTYESTGEIIDTITTLTVTATEGILTVKIIEPNATDPQILETPDNWRVVFTPEHNLLAGYYL